MSGRDEPTRRDAVEFLRSLGALTRKRGRAAIHARRKGFTALWLAGWSKVQIARATGFHHTSVDASIAAELREDPRAAAARRLAAELSSDPHEAADQERSGPSIKALRSQSASELVAQLR